MLGIDEVSRLPGYEIVTVHEVARRLGWSEPTVRRQLREGELVGEKFGRDWQVPTFRDAEGRAVFFVRGKGNNVE